VRSWGGGRKPTPSAIKRLRGNPGRRPLNEREPKPRPIIPPCPKHLEGEARTEWRRATRRLAACGVLSELDGAGLALLCTAWGRWVQAEQEIRKYGPIVKAPKTGVPMQNPWLSVANKAMEQMMKVLPEFGMTPASRSRIHAEAPEEKDELLD